jgi:nitrate/TMAO reductase-like tetraheme cytochrome c subunit
MPRVSFAAFKDPARRPRILVWTGVAVMALLFVAVIGIGATSGYWFCANVCHQVMDDSIGAYNASTHAQISCVACHIPVDADPVTFLIHKVEAGVDGAYKVVTNTYELPINPESEIAMDPVVMPEAQCTQCHSANRPVSPSRGIIIDHQVHAKNDITCTTCHNRIAHNETGYTPKLKGSAKHEDFMKMDGCFRCHGLLPTAKAPGACSVCHPTGFELKPSNHAEAGFYTHFGDSKGHAALAAASAKAAKERGAESDYCDMCHVRADFCDKCHGVPMPHPAGFAKGHGKAGKASPAVCANCHAKGKATASGTEFCNSCHHKQGDPTKPWIPQHFKVVAESGAEQCFVCHNPAYCAHCHVNVIAP